MDVGKISETPEGFLLQTDKVELGLKRRSPDEKADASSQLVQIASPATELRLLSRGKIPGLEVLVSESRALYHGKHIAGSSHLVLQLGEGSHGYNKYIHDGDDLEFSPVGRVSFCPKGDIWEILVPENTKFMILFFEEDEIIQNAADCHAAFNIEDQLLLQLLRALNSEICDPGFAHEATLQALALAIKTRVARLPDLQTTSVSTSATLTPEELNDINDMIKRYKGYNPKVVDISSHFGMSESTLLRRMKAATGQSVSEYISDVRLNKSQKLLSQTDMSLKEIAFEAGFSSASSFSSAFKRQTGYTPAAFRRTSLGV